MQAWRGRFIWFDLMTGHVEAARAFYTEVLGWKSTSRSRGEYAILAAGDRAIGGVMGLPRDAQDMPPAWVGYAGVDDIGATITRAKALGGWIYEPGADIPEVGRCAVLGDPQGAMFAVLAPLEPLRGARWEPEADGLEPHAGGLGWAELCTDERDEAWTFYSRLLGWERADHVHEGDRGARALFTLAGGTAPIGAISNAAKEMSAPPHWLFHVAVEDLDAALARVRAMGGEVVSGPTELRADRALRVARCTDPQGALFALACPR